MKNLLLLCLLLLMSACQSNSEKTSEIPMMKLEPAITKIKDVNISKELDPQVAVDFMNSYLQSKLEDEIGILEWTESNPNASGNLKSELEKMLNQAWEEDPIVGLGFDPFFDAQDFPPGVELWKFDKETGYLSLNGLCDWDGYRVTMKLINHNGKTLIDGCGVVNIPEDKQAER